MTDAGIIEDRKIVLRARGVPEKFVDALARRRDTPPKFGDVVWLGLIAVYLIVTFWVDGPAFRLFLSLFYPEAGDSVILYVPDSAWTLFMGVNFFIGLPLLVFGRILLVARDVAKFPGYDAEAAALRELDEDETLETIEPDMRFEAFADLVDDRAFLKAARGKLGLPLNALPWRPYVILVPMMILVAMGAREHGVLTGDRVEMTRSDHSFSGRLSEVRRVEVSCRSGNNDVQFDYVLKFDSAKVGLWQKKDAFHGYGPAEILSRLADLDRRLLAQGVPVDRVPDAERACIARAAKAWHLKDASTLHKLAFGSQG